MIRRIAEDLALALTFMTRLPVPCAWIRPGRTLAEALWAMPLGGVAVGALGSAVILTAHHAGLHAGLSSILAVAAMILATVALHEDGLADFVDGIGGGHSIERRLEIMRDSQIGAYGTLGLISAFAILVKLLEELIVHLNPWYFLATMIAAAAVARSSIALIFVLLRPARKDGLATFFGYPGRFNLALTLVWPASMAVVLLGVRAGALLGGALVAVLTLAAIAYRYLGGYTGDVFGASICLSFITSLIAVRLIL